MTAMCAPAETVRELAIKALQACRARPIDVGEEWPAFERDLQIYEFVRVRDAHRGEPGPRVLVDHAELQGHEAPLQRFRDIEAAAALEERRQHIDSLVREAPDMRQAIEHFDRIGVPCPQCGRHAAANAEVLQLHLWKGVLPFRCSLCGRRSRIERDGFELPPRRRTSSPRTPSGP